MGYFLLWPGDHGRNTDECLSDPLSASGPFDEPASLVRTCIINCHLHRVYALLWPDLPNLHAALHAFTHHHLAHRSPGRSHGNPDETCLSALGGVIFTSEAWPNKPLEINGFSLIECHGVLEYWNAGILGLVGCNPFLYSSPSSLIKIGTSSAFHTHYSIFPLFHHSMVYRMRNASHLTGILYLLFVTGGISLALIAPAK
jgi:hypothetical protein